MQIVIEIDDEIYNYIVNDFTVCDEFIYDIAKAIAEGIPLPEHHGDLIDKGDVLHDIDCDEEMRLGKNVEWVREVIRNAPTIIEATEKSI